jgi:hypothetical protein
MGAAGFASFSPGDTARNIRKAGNYTMNAHPQTSSLRSLIQGAAVSLLLFAVGASAQAQTSIYVLTGGGGNSSDKRVIDALKGAGFNVTVGVQTPTWNASQANLGSFDGLVMLNNANWRGQMTNEGAASIRDYVSNGGGLITGEWLSYNATRNSVLDEFLPTYYVGHNGTSTTDFILSQQDDIVSAGLGNRFKVDKAWYSGSEATLRAKGGATIFYNSSAANAVGLAGWEFGKGRVMTFSNIFASADIQNLDLDKLIVNSMKWSTHKRNGGGGGGGGVPSVTPEGSSIALMAGGVLPFGLLWAKSRRRQKS